MKKINVLSIGIGLGVSMTASAAVPYTFSAGTTARASEVNASFSNLDSRVTINETAVTTLQSDVAENASAVSSLDSRVSTLQGAVTENATAVSDLGGRLSTSENTVTTLQNAVTDLDGRVGATETSVNTLQADVTANRNAVTDLSGRVQSLEQASADAVLNVDDLFPLTIANPMTVVYARADSTATTKGGASGYCDVMTRVWSQTSTSTYRLEEVISNSVDGQMATFAGYDDSAGGTSAQMTGCMSRINTYSYADGVFAVTSAHVHAADVAGNVSSYSPPLPAFWDGMSLPAGRIVLGGTRSTSQGTYANSWEVEIRRGSLVTADGTTFADCVVMDFESRNYNNEFYNCRTDSSSRYVSQALDARGFGLIWLRQ